MGVFTSHYFWFHCATVMRLELPPPDDVLVELKPPMAPVPTGVTCPFAAVPASQEETNNVRVQISKYETRACPSAAAAMGYHYSRRTPDTILPVLQP